MLKLVFTHHANTKNINQILVDKVKSYLEIPVSIMSYFQPETCISNLLHRYICNH